mgnify:CR=1 FL=1
MFRVTGPETTTPSAWRGEAVNPMPWRPGGEMRLPQIAQLERFGEKPADLGPHLCGVERDALLPRADDETLAHGRSDAVVVREAYRALRDAGALAAEEAAPQVEREGMRGERARGTPLRGASDGFRRLVVAGSRQDGTSPEFGGQFHGVEVRNGLPAVAA